MILCKKIIKVPGRNFKTKINCVAIRRLTAMEWLIVNCAKKYSDNREDNDILVSYMFDHIFSIKNNEILIKPCIDKLFSEGFIVIDEGTSYSYNLLKMSQIMLTGAGERLLKEGMYPGEASEFVIEIYYNPLTASLSQFNNCEENTDEIIEINSIPEDKYVFPEDRIAKLLQSGLMGRGKYIASKMRIESVHELISTDWDSCVELSFELNDNVLSVIPEIACVEAREEILNLLYTKDITREKINHLQSIDKSNVYRMFGAGEVIKKTILNICKDGKFVGISNDLYKIIKNNTTIFKNRVILVFDADEAKIERKNDTSLVVFLPDSINDIKSIIINDTNENACLGNFNCKYYESDVNVPILYCDDRFCNWKKVLVERLKTIISEKGLTDIFYLALFSIPDLITESETLYDLLFYRWHDKSFEIICEDISKIYDLCSANKLKMINLNEMGERFANLFCDLDIGLLSDCVKSIIMTGCISSGSQTHKLIVDMVISKYVDIKSYNDINNMFETLGINNRLDAYYYETTYDWNSFYSTEIKTNLLFSIINDKFVPLIERTEIDSFFNSYSDIITSISLLLAGFNMFKEYDEREIKNAIAMCPSTETLIAKIFALKTKNEELYETGINIFEEIKKYDLTKATSFANNISVVSSVLNQYETDYISKVDLVKIKGDKKILKKMYIIDTCALIRHPDILLFFSDEEYVRIPTKVIDELGKIKDIRNKKYLPETSKIASSIAYNLETKYLKLFNMKDKGRLLIDNANLDLLPKELDKSVPDNHILSVGLKYTDWDTTIISDDGTFRLVSTAQKLKVISSDDFIISHEQYKRNIDRWVSDYDDYIRKQQPSTLVRKSFESVGQSVDRNTIETVNNPEEELPIDILPLKELKKYIPELKDERVFAFLQNKKIKTIGDFRKLTSDSIDAFKTDSKQLVYKNMIKIALNKFNESKETIKLKL